MQTFTKVGLDALLTPENCTLLLIDHQPSQLANVNSHDPTIVINNVTALAKTRESVRRPDHSHHNQLEARWRNLQAGSGGISRSEAHRSQFHQLMGRPPHRGSGEGDWPEKARDRRTLVGDVSCSACYSRYERRL
jgi:hypothetical protein